MNTIILTTACILFVIALVGALMVRINAKDLEKQFDDSENFY